MSEIKNATETICEQIKKMGVEEAIEAINEIKLLLHSVSPLKNNPVDCVIWVKSDTVHANDYNPNSVAPPEMELLRHSIAHDGYTQPVVTWNGEEKREVVDGFHRTRVAKECEEVKQSIFGYVPVVTIRCDNEDKKDRIASTIRHNRARGKHKVESMSDIVVELKRRNWSDERICRELGMDQDEVLRLCQITGLQEIFKDTDFSQSWDAEGVISEDDFKELTDDVDTYGEEKEEFRTVNTGDENRIFHTYKEWECYKAGFYATTFEGKTKQECEEMYREFLSDHVKFRNGLRRVVSEWKHSCEHYLTNSSMNRIAWLGQASMCIETGVPSCYRSGFFLLTEKQQHEANELALEFLNIWLVDNGRETVTMEQAYSGRQSDIY